MEQIDSDEMRVEATETGGMNVCLQAAMDKWVEQYGAPQITVIDKGQSYERLLLAMESDREGQ